MKASLAANATVYACLYQGKRSSEGTPFGDLPQSQRTDAWIRALSTDVPLPKGFDEVKGARFFIHTDDGWFRARFPLGPGES